MTVMDFQRLLPYIVLGMGAVTLLLLGAFWRGLGPRRLNILGAAIALAAGISALYTQPFPAEIGNLLVYDSFGRFFTAASSFIACVSLLFSSGYSRMRPIVDEE